METSKLHAVKLNNKESMFGYELCQSNNENKSEVIVRKLQISQYKAVNTTTDSFSLRSIMVSLKCPYGQNVVLGFHYLCNI